MEDTNQTAENGFILLGLSTIPYLQAIFFSLFLAVYVVTLVGNTLLIVAVRLNTQLQTPMYFFLCNLAFIDICFSTTVVPQLLANTLFEDGRISLLGCAAQMFISLVLGVTECLLLAVMSFDRYAAICKPLHYNVIMSKRLCIALITGCWTFCVINSFIHVVLTFKLPFCRCNHINHFFCEMPPFFRISCTEIWFNEIAMYVSTVIIVICSFVTTLTSYIHIISTILKIRSSEGRHKVFSTCASHLTVVSLYYTSIMSMYLRPHSAHSPETSKDISLLYTTVTPMLNPIVYSIRNKPVKGTIERMFTRQRCGCTNSRVFVS
ncbi:olfactory receptor 2G6-like [Pelobates fuscus]|uniref:olfactory receptor 2G6-like n=1 Tax=Pelobates fuscus TaxID=191477 RepID=UPI002FE49804